jgi:NitT/TauT family transport system substrate-binding protein
MTHETGGRARRGFLARSAALGAGAVLGLPRPAAADPPPEIRTVRFFYDPVICVAPMFLAEDLLRAEGFDEVVYVTRTADETVAEALRAGRADLTATNAPSLMLAIDAGRSISILSGLHVGCFELFANDTVHAVRDLKGKRIAISATGAGEHVYLASMLAYVGMDPRKDIRWVVARTVPESMHLFVDGQADAFLGFPPQPQELRARGVGHVIVNTTLDRPWSQYFCCVVAARSAFAREHPAATKRALRALLKAADLCARDPQRAARHLVAKGYTSGYATALEVVREMPYRSWREYQPEDTIRFHALRLHEVGMVKTSPQKLIAQGTDWRFLDALRRELKA